MTSALHENQTQSKATKDLVDNGSSRKDHIGTRVVRDQPENPAKIKGLYFSVFSLL